MNLIVGATGVLGTEICRLLTQNGKRVRGLIRKTAVEQKKEILRNLGVEFAEGDLRDRVSLTSACRNVETILSTATSIVSKQEGDSFQSSDQDGHIQLIEEAEKANVRNFIFISFPPGPFENPLQTAKQAVEARLKNGKMTYTILQPTFFQEVWLGPHLGFDAAQGKARIYGTGHSKISWISFHDVAKFAVAVMGHPYAENKTIPLGGPHALTPLEVVKIFEETQNRKWQLEFVPEEALRQQYESATDPTQKTFTGLMLSYARGAEIPMSGVLEKLPMQLQSVKQYASSSA